MRRLEYIKKLRNDKKRIGLLYLPIISVFLHKTEIHYEKTLLFTSIYHPFFL